MVPTPGSLTPYPLAMVICDGAWRDPYTGKWTLIGTFSIIGGEAFPLAHPILTVYVALTDGRGKFPIKIQLVDVDEIEEPLLEMEQESEFSDQRVVGELVFQASGVMFPAPGEYRLMLFANGEFLIERQIIVLDKLRGEAQNE